MSGAPGLAAIGPVMQMAYVPGDFDAALCYWTETMGVGPFFLIENIALKDMRYRGEPSDAVFSIALAYWGDVQIELIRAENDAPSIYGGDYGVTDRLHHVCILTDDIADARAICDAQSAEILVEAKVGEDGAVLYADPGAGPGNLVEILQPASGSADLFAMIGAAAADWDGSEPVRRLG
ncbi:VOC family protein [Parasphingopyxis algicola]|uniref:VOC family protein n=1 Tax=Parasphingopyxis algicola TaxID=2026624 RepID=UPI00159FE6D9|nr:VOC family protein [Parasphingopyxis algicola]QLC25415.1 VOC family protein [Parasphingopyxis algicola]